MSDAPAVSIITPTYNHGRFLAQAIESVLAQTFSSWEQIIIDDGSTDDTGAVAGRYRDPRIRYLRQDNRGIERLPETYNDALAMCRAPLVAILEGDDYWPADKLATLVPAFADPEVVLAYGWTEVFGERGTFPARIPSDNFDRRFAPTVATNSPPGRAALAMCDCRALTFTYPCSVVVRRSALERIGGFQSRPGLCVTDHPTFLRLALEGRFHFERRIMGYWRVHDAGTTARGLDRILAALYPEILRFRAEFGARLPVSEAEWRQIDRDWRPLQAWASMSWARRLLLEQRWSEARSHLQVTLRRGSWRMRLVALAALAGARVQVPAEWVYRLARQPYFRRTAPGKVETVLPAPDSQRGSGRSRPTRW
jgi:glycosyltransferase involved in cell wall biosynthesis